MSDPVRLRRRLAEPNWERLFAVFAALRQGWTVEEVAEVSHIDPWFLREIRGDRRARGRARLLGPRPRRPARCCGRAKAAGLSDARIAGLLHCQEARARRARSRSAGIRRVYKRVDTCAAEFPATTPYLYSTWGQEDETRARTTARRW